MNRMTFERLDIRPDDHVLEVGFGGGDLIEWMLAATRAEVTGVDLSEAMVQRARRRFADEVGQGRLRVFSAEVENMPLPDASVDRACSVNSLYFWADAPAALAEFARLLRRGGRLVLCFQTPEAVRAWPGHIHGFRAYGADEVAALMAAGGFQNVFASSGADRAVGEFVCMSGERRHG